MSEDTFHQLYNQLNEKQREAVDTVEGPVMVVAGPGTGKTHILALRIANILRQTDVEPENILAITFTEAGVISMRRKLVEIMGSPAYQVEVTTFHSFCNDIIQEYPEEFPHIIGATHVGEVEQINMIEEILQNDSFDVLKPFGDPMHYVRPILSAITDLKREDTDPEAFHQIVERERAAFEQTEDLYHKAGPHKGKMKGKYRQEQKNINKNAELAVIYEQYQEMLRERGLYDYNDMIMEVLRALQRNEDLLLILQERHQYILVDEHQDTNNAQNKVIELLGSYHEHPNIFVVGDQKQAIFRFQGASLANFEYFTQTYPDAAVIELRENYRSQQRILDAAGSVLAGELQSKTGYTPDNIRVCALSRPEVEQYFIARDIAEKIEEGAEPAEIAVLYRTNKDAFDIAASLEKTGVPFVIESDQDILADPDIAKIIRLLRCIANPTDEHILRTLHIDFLQIDPLDAYRIINYANKERMPVYDIISDERSIRSLGLSRPEAIQRFQQNMSRWMRQAYNENFPNFFERIVRESGLLQYLLAAADPLEKMDKLNGLFDEIQAFVERHREADVWDFLQYLDTLREHNVLLKKSSTARSANRVRLMTAHRSKGQEFDHVYIARAFEGHWGNRRMPTRLRLPSAAYSLSGENVGEQDIEDDERRLFYVALTRARKGAIITYAKENRDKREQLPSQFIEEIRDDLIGRMDTTAIENEFAQHTEVMYEAPRTVSTPVYETEFIRELFSERGLSVTALNNYLRCPWQYFYNNLLRIPKPKEPFQMFGTAVHAALKDFFDKLAVGDNAADRELLMELFRHYLNREPFTEQSLGEWQERGEQALSGYYDTYAGSWNTNVLTEMHIRGVMLDGNVRLTGKLDKVSFLGTDINEVDVTDYKTGKPKSRNWIEGNTKNSEGDYKRQLVFYKLLLDLHKEGHYRMRHGIIDFVEPNDSGKHKSEAFEITQEEVEQLTDTIRRVANEVWNLSFWDERCEDADCEWCALRESMGS